MTFVIYNNYQWKKLPSNPVAISWLSGNFPAPLLRARDLGINLARETLVLGMMEGTEQL